MSTSTFLVTGITHLCDKQGVNAPPYWDRGYWVIGNRTLKGKASKCPYCGVVLPNIDEFNSFANAEGKWYNAHLAKFIPYKTLQLFKVDLRKKENKDKTGKKKS